MQKTTLSETDSTQNSEKTQPKFFPGLTLIWAQGRRRVIGCKGRLPWHIPADLARFKSLTMGHPVIMGRLTFESLPKKPLPGRLNIVVSNQRIRDLPSNTKQAASLGSALLYAASADEVFAIGGGMIYSGLLPLAERLCITEVDIDVPDGDAFAPVLPESWRLRETGEWQISDNLPPYRFLEYSRESSLST